MPSLMQCLFVFRGQVIPYGWVWCWNPMDAMACKVAWCDNWRDKFEAADWDNACYKAACKRLYSANKRFCSIPLTSYTLHVTTIPSFPPSIFCRHLPAARISLCNSLSHPSSSTLQTTRFQHPCDVPQTPRPCHPAFPTLDLSVSLTWRPQRVVPLAFTS